jgi:hypothetical protein
MHNSLDLLTPVDAESAASVIEVTESEVVSIRADKLWHVISDFTGSLDEYVDLILDSQPADPASKCNQPGAVRLLTVDVPDPLHPDEKLQVKETLTALDPDNRDKVRSITYEFTNPDEVPGEIFLFKDGYESVLSVRQIDAKTSEIVWQATFNSSGNTDADKAAAAQLQQIFAGGLSGLENLFENC